jgi:hypothetical protein
MVPRSLLIHEMISFLNLKDLPCSSDSQQLIE